MVTAYYKIRARSFRTNRRTTVTVKYNKETKELVNPRSIAFNSWVGWGKVEISRTIKNPFGYAYEVMTPSHGGIILVTTEKVQQLEDKGYTASNGCTTPPTDAPAVYIYEFEEDCNYAIFLSLSQEAFKSWWNKRDWLEKPSYEKVTGMIRASLERWNKEFIPVFENNIKSKPLNTRGAYNVAS